MRRPSPHPLIVPIISAAMGRPTLRPPTMPVISTSVGRPTPHSPIVPVISTGVGRRFFPPSLPRRCRPTQLRNLSSIDRASPQPGQLNRYSSATKMPRLQSPNRIQAAQFQHVPSSCRVYTCWQNSSAYYQQLTVSFCAHLSLFAPPIFCFQRVVDSFAQNTGRRG